MTAVPAEGIPDRWRLVPVGSDKRPLLRSWPERAVPVSDLDTIGAWLRRWPRAGLAVVTGPASGILVIDIDAPGESHQADGFAALHAFQGELGPLPETAEAVTPSGGEHRFFRWPAGVRRISSRPLVPGVDVKASAGLVTLPLGRRTPTRRWLRPPAAGLAELPARWRARVLPPPPTARPMVPNWQPSRSSDSYLAAALRSAAERIASAAPGTRHAVAFKETASLARLADRGLNLRAAGAALVEAALAAGLPRHEAERTVRDALQRGLPQ